MEENKEFEIEIIEESQIDEVEIPIETQEELSFGLEDNEEEESEEYEQ